MTETKDKDEDKPDISIKEIKVRGGSDVITGKQAGNLKTEGQNESKYEYRSSLFDLPPQPTTQKSVIRKTSTGSKLPSRPVSRVSKTYYNCTFLHNYAI